MEKWEKFFGRGWAETLERFLSSSEFESIGNYIRKEKAAGKLVTPDSKLIFRAFKECPWNKLHTVIMGTEPYTGRVDNTTYVADGLAFSARKCLVPPRQLKLFKEAIDKEIYQGDGTHIGESNDLTFLANQGVLLLNYSLTFGYGVKDMAHSFLWKRMMEVVIKEINDNKNEIAFILMGAKPTSLKHLITNNTFTVHSCEHPNEALWRGGKWNSGGVFKAVDAYQKVMNNIKINWCETKDDRYYELGEEKNTTRVGTGVFR